MDLVSYLEWLYRQDLVKIHHGQLPMAAKLSYPLYANDLDHYLILYSITFWVLRGLELLPLQSLFEVAIYCS